MDASVWAAVMVASISVLFLVLRKRIKFTGSGDRRLPPGSFGLPVVGQTLGFLRALRGNTGEAWLRRWAALYGPVSRFSFLGVPTALLVGPAANKFVFSSSGLTAMTTTSFRRMIGGRNIRDLAGADHRRVRAMMVAFLKLDAVKGYVATMDSEVRRHLRSRWHGHASVAVLPSMKSLTFDIMCTVIFGLDAGDARRRELAAEFVELVRGIWTVPVDLPFTTFRRCLGAARRGRRLVAGVIEEKRGRLRRGESSPGDDLISHMLSEGVADEEIVDNVMFIMVAAHDTTALLLTFLIRHLQASPEAYAKVAAEQHAIAEAKRANNNGDKEEEEALTWEDLGKMRYTWAAAMETLRLVPPVFVTMKKAVRDVEFEGRVIPEGWQVMSAMNLTQWDPAIFPDPGRFEPARFAAEAAAAVPPYSFVAFGGGGRICPGNEFARVETLVAVHYIVTGFRWKLAAGCDGSFSRFPLPSPAQGLLIDIQHIHNPSICKAGT